MSYRLLTNERALVLPFALILLSFVAMYTLFLIGIYETNIKLYDEMEIYMEKEIQSLYNMLIHKKT
ncbi:hypothetical protein [Kurthia sibirica]|uniref:Uncharacterized protein n=1 Tax=Kurthia sibirica TaxID=202750 RepID=A0A2U3ALZ0_9BACL|nr:hypothetical protein [Kurthia sibirica]PWI25531.1 hypothetical protein DEX24_07950 [Kurthia sibirica]GEK33907.1 hypothetical protein KSI01_14400 [Kurthia sibirica]